MITTQCHNSATAGRVPGSDLPGQPQRLAPCVLGSSSRLDTGLGLLLRQGLRRCGVGRAGALGLFLRYAEEKPDKLQTQQRCEHSEKSINSLTFMIKRKQRWEVVVEFSCFSTVLRARANSDWATCTKHWLSQQ